MLKGVIFDMDGVLVDNAWEQNEAYKQLGERYGVEIDQAKLKNIFGRGNDEILPDILPGEVIDNEGIEKLSDMKEAIYRKLYADKIKPVAGLKDLIDNLKSNGVKIALGSSGPPENVEFVLEKCGLDGYFDVVVDGTMVEKRKPDPEIFLLSANKLGVDPQQALVFEDAVAGIEAARSAGMKVVALSTSLPKPDLEKMKPEKIIEDFRGIDYDIIASL